ncbi:hypothetical protein [Pseudomonas sp. Gutcm_11s]|uniref:hypothetical protein n=1 Tax=Pseudomonas sp. Gutcm_11s TaxID=3026088 RepID=UPI002361864A|nr:hypothetical protein [Pseudomonas sp. Gutcm_11s]MDD0843365.1 hypothetical protein [Pseudomonas sp. Gutcm_11s]
MSQGEQARPLPMFRFDRTSEGWRLSLSVQLRGQCADDDSAESVFRRGIVALEDVIEAMRGSLEEAKSEQLQGGEA